MKKIKIILSIAGFAFTSICFGQLLSQNKSDVLFYSAHYNLASNRIEHQVNNYPARTTSGDHFEAPVSSKTYFVPLEFDWAIEEWMTLPFESSVYEEELQIESWMLTPFESNYYELDPSIEQWMTAPFESGEEIEIEAWMSTIWI
jgi:hypothetical protein